MKTLIASDFHGKDPTDLVRTLSNNGSINRAVFLGDYDEPYVLRNIRNLNLDKLVLVGNHEYEFARKSGKVGFIDGVTQMRYWKMWGDNEAGKFALNGPTKIEDIISDKKVVYLHGSLVDACDSEMPSDVWGCLHDFHQFGFSHERRVECNFNEMKKKNYWIMFRGHDHKAEMYSTNEDGYIGHYHQIRKSTSDTILQKEDMNIITVGPFEKGNYCLFDNDTFSLEFKKI